MHIYLQGLTMGLAYVAPIGLQNLFVINSALTQKRSRVYITALIVILWDVSLGVACFLGAGALMQAVPWLQKVILGLGSLIVIYIGVGLLRAKASLEGGKDVNIPIWKLFTTAFVVTWMNPQALIDGTMMLGAFRALYIAHIRLQISHTATSLHVLFRPVRQSLQNGQQRPAPLRGAVFHPHRHLQKLLPLNKSVPLQLLQSRRQHRVAHPVQLSPQGVVADGPGIAHRAEDLHLPLAANEQHGVLQGAFFHAGTVIVTHK